MSALTRHALLLALAACGKSTSPVRAVEVARPSARWGNGAAVVLEPALRLPTSPDGRDRIVTWLALPEGGKITTQRLLLPAGTVADRVEYDCAPGEPDLGKCRVSDVRGTTFTADGELFHVYRGAAMAVDEPLRGIEWPRGDAASSRAADAALRELVHQLPVGARANRDQIADHLVGLNDCAACHAHDQPAGRRPDHKIPDRATDGEGLYSLLAVLADESPIPHERRRDLNADDPYIHVHTADGLELGTLDVAAALAAGDAHARAVCASRAYLRDHMDDAARAWFGRAFAECGLP